MRNQHVLPLLPAAGLGVVGGLAAPFDGGVLLGLDFCFGDHGGPFGVEHVDRGLGLGDGDGDVDRQYAVDEVPLACPPLLIHVE